MPGITIAIDVGNTRAKLGLWLGQELLQSWQAPLAAVSDSLAQRLPHRVGPCQVGWISVADPSWRPEALPLWTEARELTPTFTRIDADFPFPLTIRYATPQTLGTDRVVGVVAARARCPQQPVLVIDAGTALTFDFATAAGAYLGGAISPGLHMRLRALHTFTARLPLVEIVDPPPLVGNSTTQSLQTGVYHGMLAEIDGVAQRYQQAYGPDVQVFLTGGDFYRFENQLTCLNFADSNLVLKGIFQLLSDPHSA